MYLVLMILMIEWVSWLEIELLVLLLHRDMTGYYIKTIVSRIPVHHCIFEMFCNHIISHLSLTIFRHCSHRLFLSIMMAVCICYIDIGQFGSPHL